MNRRRFFGTFLGLAAVPSIIVSALKATPKIAGSDLVLSSYPITSKPRKLKAEWTAELQQDLQCYNNISTEMSEAIQKEIDQEYLRTIDRIV